MSEVPVIMCTWRRINRLEKTIRLLEAQKSGTHPELYIWNNNFAEKDAIDSIIVRSHIRVKAYHHHENIGGFGRFYFARILAEKHPFIIFIDDDQEFDKNFLETFFLEATPKTLISYWAFRINNYENYWNREPLRPYEDAVYCGTGGMICDSSLFKDSRLYDCPFEYRFIEDLWLSYFASHILGWRLLKSSALLSIIEDGLDQGIDLTEKKNNFLKLLVASGWRYPIRVSSNINY